MNNLHSKILVAMSLLYCYLGKIDKSNVICQIIPMADLENVFDGGGGGGGGGCVCVCVCVWGGGWQ